MLSFGWVRSEQKVTEWLLSKDCWSLFPLLNLVYTKTSLISSWSGEGNPELSLLERALNLHFISLGLERRFCEDSPAQRFLVASLLLGLPFLGEPNQLSCKRGPPALGKYTSSLNTEAD